MFLFIYLTKGWCNLAACEFDVVNVRASQLEDNEESDKVLIMGFGNACCASRIRTFGLSDFRTKGQFPSVLGS